jgi:hypothetical protein
MNASCSGLMRSGGTLRALTSGMNVSIMFFAASRSPPADIVVVEVARLLFGLALDDVAAVAALIQIEALPGAPC